MQPALFLSVLATAAMLSTASLACPPEVYVDASAPPGGDGASWATAFNELQDAVQCPDARIIHVAEGTYDPGAEDSYVPFDGVSIFGGYPAGGGERDPDLFETILSGAEPQHSILVSIEDCSIEGVILDGLTFTGITAKDRPGYAVLSESSLTTLRRCRFTGNSMEDGGRAVYAPSGELLVADCHFENNRTRSFDCYAGPAAIYTETATRILRSTFIGNEDRSHYGSSCFPLAFGGAVWTWSEEPTIILDCYFEGNLAWSSGFAYGGAIAVSGRAIIGNCMFVNNRAEAQGFGSGGAIDAGAWDVPSVTIFNCVFAGNTADSGGGAIDVFQQERLRIANSTFVNNTPDSIRIEAGEPAQILNSIVRGTGLKGEIVGDEAIVLFSNITGGYPGRENIDIEPMLDIDYRLLPGSPCIDAGTSSPIPGWLWGDFDRNPRKVDDPNTPNTGRGDPPIDMGAFEYQP